MFPSLEHPQESRMTYPFEMRSTCLGADKHTIQWTSSGESILETAAPLVVESMATDGLDSPDGNQTIHFYQEVQQGAEGLVASSRFNVGNGATGIVTDRWSATSDSMFTVHRSVAVESAPPDAGLRFGLHVRPAFAEGLDFNDLQYYAPNACYNLNDLNEDGVCDYLDTKHLSYRDDRLNSLSVLAFHPQRKLALSLSRVDVPKYDDDPVRNLGQRSFLHDTDIGALGFQPSENDLNGSLLTAYYPFVERARSNALLVEARTPWGAFRPVRAGDSFSVTYAVRLYHCESAHDALWTLMKAQMAVLRPEPVKLDRPPEDISRLRLETLSQYYMEDSAGGSGFVTNCHPQDGKQLGNIVQYGFTGQNILNATNLLQAPTSSDLDRKKARNVIDFYVSCARKSPYGFTYGLYDVDRQRHNSWWTGLLLPLAYAEPGQDLESLMGPLYSHRQTVIEALSRSHGVYTRCVLEETEALLALYLSQEAASASWLEVVTSFGEFLLGAQESDGSWRRAYSLEGQPLIEPAEWFGQTFYQQRSSTATAIPLLLDLARITAKEAYRTAAVRAGRFVRTHFVDKVRHNGGIHDSIYAKPQLIDHESIYFCCRALLALYDATGSDYFRTGAVRAGQLSASWILLWDIPLPPKSTLARQGFRSTGWAGCDTPGAGYVHPMGIIAAPDFLRLAQITGDAAFLDIAELTFMACNENVGLKWGYATDGMQEEGVLLSPWLVDDPMFAAETGFGGRSKGEGNKTCLPWISAVTVWSGNEIKRRFGTLDFDELREKFQLSPSAQGA